MFPALHTDEMLSCSFEFFYFENKPHNFTDLSVYALFKDLKEVLQVSKFYCEKILTGLHSHRG